MRVEQDATQPTPAFTRYVASEIERWTPMVRLISRQ
jgi:hypothetical protein